MNDTDDGVGRRRFMQLLGSGAAVGSWACTRPPKEELLPFAHQPELRPGTSSRYATALIHDGVATGLIVTTVDGRPIKVDGNPAHPTTLGGSRAIDQAAILDLYNPLRLQGVRERGQPSTWSRFRELFLTGLPSSGRGLALVLAPSSSPLAKTQLDAIAKRFPEARVHFHAPWLSRAPSGLKRVTGEALLPKADVASARVVACLGGDVLGSGPWSLVHSRGFGDSRRIEKHAGPPPRLYSLETTFTPTGMSADHRLALTPLQLLDATRVLVARLAQGRESLPSPTTGLPKGAQQFIDVMARDLFKAGDSGLVMVADDAPPELHALGQAANALLRNERLIELRASPVFDHAGEGHDTGALVHAMEAGEITHLLVIDADPAYDDPRFQAAMSRVTSVAVLASEEDATAARAHWLLPATHPFEAWSDARAADGTLTLAQPLIAPLYDGRSAHDLLGLIAGEPESSTRDRLMRLHATQNWSAAVRRGFIPDTAFAPVRAAVRWNAVAELLRAPPVRDVPFELHAFPDLRLHDGRHASNPWLQELPDPATKQTWGNALLVSPEDAKKLGVATGDMLRVNRETAVIEGPALVLPGQASGALSIAAGHGRHLHGVEAHGIHASLIFPGPVEVRAIAGRVALALTQENAEMEDRAIAVERSFEAFQAHPKLAHEELPTGELYAPPKKTGPQWAMAIDLGACTGCSACVVACQSENNVAVVGRHGVLKRHEMHWIRIDRYFTTEPASARAQVQPMLCQHCEMAPCEYVCPVNATTHSPDGINEMTYNRCVGTRFCSNNCPYKVRRFNWSDYRAHEPPVVQLAANPNVTVRARGVMEKCTFCVQRLRSAEIEAQRTRRPIDTKSLNVACAEACPTRAIVFGDQTDSESPLAALLESPRAYGVFEELGTRPRVRYLARLRNPNPELA